jgi:hypothetical protein
MRLASPLVANHAQVDSDGKHLEGPEIPPEVREFCVEKQIEDAVRKTLVLARTHFAMTGDPWLEVASDPEYDDRTVAIHVRVSGGIDEVSAQREAFLDSFVDRIDPDKQRYINLIYHPA